ncbi:RNA polymerase II subunit A C-terminal domain phosphatase-like isoform X2 [Amphibalanus amphitrite]|uniref:RNA polymerase II subunit A C-terminal domain phosphatase-like isoform X2 n=1 Tax=Amphibalanus amphitrite TaxID=1232801 RepID=UPI001C90B96A|nr:RNA polymerase II subunit A C-terminal domain phosphatase-like isoform X2 [Amphibalanus amphitrite]
MSTSKVIRYSGNQPITIKRWKAKEGDFVSVGAILFTYAPIGDAGSGSNASTELKFKSDAYGNLEKIAARAGETVQPGIEVAQMGACPHPVVMKDMCAECGADLRTEDSQGSASVAMLHSIPELRVSKEQAETIGKRDTELLLQHKKLVLLVDLDQTLIHTTNDEIPANIKDVYHFQLYGSNSPWYHTRFRPGTQEFLKNISKYYELHICTFGARLYAHTIAKFLDPDGVYFSNRILSRDECFNQQSKTANLRALFPCGDKMVCIIDDREDVWNYAPNLIHVKPYHFFKHTGDINAPPGLEKAEQDDKEGFDFSKLETTKEEPPEEDGRPPAGAVQRRDSMPNLSDDEDEGSNDKPDPSSVEQATPAVAEELSDDLNISDDDDDEAGSSPQDPAALPAEDDKRTADLSPNAKSPDGSEPAADNSRQKDTAEITSLPEPTAEQSREPDGVDSRSAPDQDGCDSGGAGEPGGGGVSGSPKPGVAPESPAAGDAAAAGSSPAAAREAEAAGGSQADAAGEQRFPSDVRDGAAASETRELEVEDTDDYLSHLEDILLLIHRAFYSMLKKSDAGEPPDLRLLIPYVRKKVLKGVRLVFSGVVPNNQELSSSRPYQVATNLGAVVQDRLVRKGPRDELTTHLVAARLGTAKVNEALRSKRIQLVTLDWLWSCAERWERVDERLFPLRADTAVSRAPPAHCSSPDPQGERTRRQSFQETLNPLLTFSPDDIARMDEEVEDILQSGSDQDDDADDDEARRETPPPRRVFSRAPRAQRGRLERRRVAPGGHRARRQTARQ